MSQELIKRIKFKNNNNLCFAESSLQILLNIPLFVQKILNYKNEENNTEKNEIYDYLKIIIKNLEENKEILLTKDFAKKILGESYNITEEGEKYDMVEFMQNFLKKLDIKDFGLNRNNMQNYFNSNISNKAELKSNQDIMDLNQNQNLNQDILFFAQQPSNNGYQNKSFPTEIKIEGQDYVLFAIDDYSNDRYTVDINFDIDKNTNNFKHIDSTTINLETKKEEQDGKITPQYNSTSIIYIKKDKINEYFFSRDKKKR